MSIRQLPTDKITMDNEWLHRCVSACCQRAKITRDKKKNHKLNFKKAAGSVPLVSSSLCRPGDLLRYDSHDEPSLPTAVNAQV